MEIETSARLHVSLIDLNGSEGRIDGGIGITLENPSLILECNYNDSKTEILFDDNCRFRHLPDEYKSKILLACERIQNYLGINNSYTFRIRKCYPIHHGLGLGTQLLLSTAQLVARLNEADLSVYELAKIVQRGGTSGIGVHSFNHGGLIVDGGHKKEYKNDFLPSSASDVAPPPLLARYDFPKDWNILLATPNFNQGANGKKEINIFQDYSPVNLGDVEKICYITLMKLMPAVLEEDIVSFGEAINKIQNLGFKKVERNFQSERVNNIISYMLDNGIPGAGMSSFGPTCFGITDTNVKSMKKDLQDLAGNNSIVQITNGKNEGSQIK